MDHVIPRSLGGKLEWENTVTSCRKCNGRKGSLLPSELHIVGMQLKSKPRRPSLFELAAEAQKFVPKKGKSALVLFHHMNSCVQLKSELVLPMFDCLCKPYALT